MQNIYLWPSVGERNLFAVFEWEISIWCGGIRFMNCVGTFPKSLSNRFPENRPSCPTIVGIDVLIRRELHAYVVFDDDALTY